MAVKAPVLAYGPGILAGLKLNESASYFCSNSSNVGKNSFGLYLNRENRMNQASSSLLLEVSLSLQN